MSFLGNLYSDLADKSGELIDTGVGMLSGGGAALGCALAFPPAAFVTAPVCGFVGTYLGSQGSKVARRKSSQAVRDWIAGGKQGPAPPGASLLSSGPGGDIPASSGPRGDIAGSDEELHQELLEPGAQWVTWSTFLLALLVSAIAGAAVLIFGVL